MMQVEAQIHEALECLDLPTLVTKADIKKRYRQLARTHHPDLSREAQGKMEKINASYTILMEYVEMFRYTFDADEIRKHYPGAAHAKTFEP